MPTHGNKRGNKLIVVTQVRADARRGLAAQLKTRGRAVYALPTLRIVKKKLTAAGRAALRTFNACDYLIFTSAHAVEFFGRAIQNARSDARPTRAPRHVKIIAIGKVTAAAARRFGFRVAIMPDRFTARDVAKNLRGFHAIRGDTLRGKNILLPQSAIASPELAKSLKKNGARVTKVPLYTTMPAAPDAIADQKFHKFLMAGRIGCITFASPSAVSGLSKRVKKPMMRRNVCGLPAVCIGPRTAVAARAFGFKKVVVAETFTTEGIVKALEKLD